MLLTQRQILARAKTIGAKQGKLNGEIHTLLCHSTVHALEHGDITGTTAIFKAVKGTDRGAIAKWVHAYGLGRLAASGEFAVNKTARLECSATLEELLAGETWYSMVPTEQDIAKEWDSEKFAGQIKAYMTKAEAKAKEHDEVLAGAVSKAFSEFMRQLELVEIKELIIAE